MLGSLLAHAITLTPGDVLVVVEHIEAAGLLCRLRAVTLSSGLEKGVEGQLRPVVHLGRLGASCGLLVDDCLLYTSDAADEEDSVDLGGRRIIKKKKKEYVSGETIR
eukprot:TRINITY_DN23710_c0_g1_i1.p1 TRINITY_DN23710_c0_g1~~TRINITY_DN23710_c0_g1_i1.p1  ORF type:complete len:107 (-),score=20.77 TRINITY_DN23710_c0_g1_i1:93-413(-)